MQERLLPNWIEAFLQYTDNEEPPFIFKKWTALATIAATLERKCWLKYAKIQTFPNIYVILVGPSSSRKGTALEPGLQLLTKIGVNLAADCTSMAALAIDMENSRDTIDGMTDGVMNYSHCSLTAFSGELGVFIHSGDDHLVKVLTDWFDCKGNWNKRTKHGSSENISNVCFNILGGTTPTDLSNMSAAASTGGLSARMIFPYANKKGKSNPEPEDTDWHKDTWKKLEHDLFLIYRLKGAFKYTPEYRERYNKWYYHQDANPPFVDRLFEGYVGRRAAYVKKLSMINSASRSSNMVLDVKDLMFAIESLQEVEVDMQFALGGVGDNNNVGVMHLIEQDVRDHKEVGLADTYYKYRRFVGNMELSNIIAHMESAEMIKIIRQPPSGKKPYMQKAEVKR